MQNVYEQAKQGDARAVRAVVDALRSRVVSMARHYGRRCDQDADDLQQVAWLGVLESLPGLDLSIGSADQYLLQRARWKLLDDIKRSYVRRTSPLPDESAQEPAAIDSGDWALSSACVSDFVGQLSDVQKAVVRHLSDGKTWREAGSAMGCSSANIAYHVRQIRRRYAAWSGDASEAGEPSGRQPGLVRRAPIQFTRPVVSQQKTVAVQR